MSIARARALRASPTDAERLIWLKLRDRRLMGAKFRRQVSFPPYTVDFCCFEAKLIVEVDRSQHAERLRQDAVRTRRLEGDGFSVIRFWNNDVLKNIDDIHFSRLTSADVVRHSLVGRIVDAYSEYDEKRTAARHEREQASELANRAERRAAMRPQDRQPRRGR